MKEIAVCRNVLLFVGCSFRQKKTTTNTFSCNYMNMQIRLEMWYICEIMSSTKGFIRSSFHHHFTLYFTSNFYRGDIFGFRGGQGFLLKKCNVRV